jgi:hypothetical protein
MRATLLAVILFASVGCVKSADPNALSCVVKPSATPKSLFSLWTATDCSETVDLSTTNVMEIKLSNGARCSCTNTLCGTTAAGSYLFTACSYAGGGTGDPGCQNLTGHGGNFSASNTELTICDTTCTTYW